MRLCRSSITIFACLACLGIDPIAPSNAVLNTTLALSRSNVTQNVYVLSAGSRGKGVETLQTQLHQLGYYDGKIDGRYGENTSNAISKFQQAKGLTADGTASVQTQNLLQHLLVASKQKQANVFPIATQASITKQESSSKDLLWWLIVAAGSLGVIGAVFYLAKIFGKQEKVATSNSHPQINNGNHTMNEDGNTSLDISSPTELLLPEKTSRLAKVNIVEQLIQDLHSPDPNKRRKAIWDLGQQGDSRAIGPLTELMIDGDSQQRSLILGALSEIGTRTLKPMNRALAISLQDESPQVRQNAIRDLTRVYDTMAQISQMLSHAVEDSDPEVQATARYALSQMNRIRALPNQQEVNRDDED